MAEIILPKAGELADVKRVVVAGAKAVMLLIESAQGIKHINQLAQQERVKRLIFGSIDFCVDMGIEGDDRELDYFPQHEKGEGEPEHYHAPVTKVDTAYEGKKEKPSTVFFSSFAAIFMKKA